MASPDSYLMSFWADNNLYASGRDPLGIRNSSAVIFAKLLPGLTSVTKRIRLYGFYSWILQHFYATNEMQSREKQMQFIRRCEVLLSYIMASRVPRIAGMDGNSYADNLLDELAKSNETKLDIHTPALFYKASEKNKTYYQAQGGVLDVVYVGSLINLGLIARLQEKDNLLVPTLHGKELASDFDVGISEVNKSLFFNSIEAGTIHIRQLSGLLEDFDLVRDIRGSGEWNFYSRLLAGPDCGFSPGKASFFRRENIRYYLDLYEKKPFLKPGKEYPAYFYENGLNDGNTLDPVRNLWSIAELSEKIHYCLETLFWCILQLLDQGESRIPITLFAKHFATIALDSLFPEEKDEIRSQSLGKWVSTLKGETLSENDVDSFLRKKDTHKVIGVTLRFLYSLYHIQANQLSALESCLKQQGLSGHQGNVFRDYMHFFLAWEDKPLLESFERLSLRLINQHMEVAFTKMSQGRNNVLRITVEDNCLIKLAPDYPAQVANRVHQFHMFLTDMRFIDKTGLTPEGEMLQKELSNA